MHNISNNRGKKREKKRNETKTRSGMRSEISLYKVAVCGVGMWFQLMITNDISEWPLLGDSFLDVIHSELLRTWQVNNIICSCVQTVPLTTVKYQHKANTASVTLQPEELFATSVCDSSTNIHLENIITISILFTYSSTIEANIDIEIPNIGPFHETKCDMTCTQRVSSSPAMQNQYPSSFCSHLYNKGSFTISCLGSVQPSWTSCSVYVVIHPSQRLLRVL